MIAKLTPASSPRTYVQDKPITYADMNRGLREPVALRCDSCGQTLPTPPALCTCGHPDTSHDLTPSGRRTWCAHGSQAGPCRCRVFAAQDGAAG